MWRRWQLPCIALSLNNGMLICITRDVITSTVKRKHNNSSSAPPWDRLGWPTLALWRDALELWLSQTHKNAHMCTLARTHTRACTHGHTVAHSRKLLGAQLFLSAHAVQLVSCWPPLLKHGHTRTHTHTSKRTSAFIQMLLRCTHQHATSPAGWGSCRNVDRFDLCLYKKKKKKHLFTIFPKITLGTVFFFFLSFILLFFWLCFTRTWQDLSLVFCICILSCNSRLPFWRWAADRVEKAVSGSSTVNTVQFRGKKQNVFLSLEVMLQCWWLERLS